MRGATVAGESKAGSPPPSFLAGRQRRRRWMHCCRSHDLMQRQEAYMILKKNEEWMKKYVHTSVPYVGLTLILCPGWCCLEVERKVLPPDRITCRGGSWIRSSGTPSLTAYFLLAKIRVSLAAAAGDHADEHGELLLVVIMSIGGAASASGEGRSSVEERRRPPTKWRSVGSCSCRAAAGRAEERRQLWLPSCGRPSAGASAVAPERRSSIYCTFLC